MSVDRSSEHQMGGNSWRYSPSKCGPFSEPHAFSTSGREYNKAKEFQAMTVLASKRTLSMVLEGSDRELVEACRRGERDAFRALFEAYKDKVYSIALRFAGDQ